MVMVVEGGEGRGLRHGILCTFMGDGMRGQEQKSHHSRLQLNGVGVSQCKGKTKSKMILAPPQPTLF